MINVFYPRLDGIWKYFQVRMIVIIFSWYKQPTLLSHNCINLNSNKIAIVNNHVTMHHGHNTIVNQNKSAAKNKFISREVQQLLCNCIRINTVNSDVKSRSTNKSIKNKQFSAIQDSVSEMSIQNAKKLTKKGNNTEYLASNKYEDKTPDEYVVNENTRHIMDIQENKMVVEDKVLILIHAKVIVFVSMFKQN